MAIGDYSTEAFGTGATMPDWMSGTQADVWNQLFGGTGGIGAAYQEPADIYSQFASRFRRPQQEALYGAYNPLLSQYQLQRLGGSAGLGTSFGDFLGTAGVRPAGAEMNPATSLLEMARMAGRYGAMTDTDLAKETEAARGLTLDDIARRAYAQQVYGGGQQAGANQLAVAQMLAMRNPGASSSQFGYYGGDVGSAIQQGMANLQRGFRGAGGDEREFLNFLLSATNPAVAQNGNGA